MDAKYKLEDAIPKTTNDFLEALTDSMPVWSYFISGTICTILGVCTLITPNILELYEANITTQQEWILYCSGCVWIMGGFSLSLFIPIRKIFRILRITKHLVKKDDCEKCHLIIREQAKKINILEDTYEHVPR